MVAIFRQLSSSILRLLQPSLSLLSVSFILSPSTTHSILLSPHFINKLSTTSWPCCLTSTLAIPAVPEPKTLHQKALLPAETMFHTISSVNWAGNISASHVHIWAWTDLCEKNGSSLDEFTCKTLHWESDGSQAVGEMYTVQCCRSGFNFFKPDEPEGQNVQNTSFVSYLDEAVIKVKCDGSLTRCYWLSWSVWRVEATAVLALTVWLLIDRLCDILYTVPDPDSLEGEK